MPFFDGATPTYNQRERETYTYIDKCNKYRKDLDFVPIFKM